VKLHPLGDRSGFAPAFLPGRRFRSAGVPLVFVIAFAYNLPFQGTQLSGGPAWIRTAEGIYDIDTEGWAPMRPRAARPPGREPTAEDLAFADPARPTLYMLFDKLGLKMDSSEARVDMFVIDHVEKPTEN
jgi:Protein of unknown function (DUF3738)